jgi:hypothetical protein
VDALNYHQRRPLPPSRVMLLSVRNKKQTSDPRQTADGDVHPRKKGLLSATAARSTPLLPFSRFGVTSFWLLSPSPVRSELRGRRPGRRSARCGFCADPGAWVRGGLACFVKSALLIGGRVGRVVFFSGSSAWWWFVLCIRIWFRLSYKRA